MNKSVTVIVPLYKGEKYVDKIITMLSDCAYYQELYLSYEIEVIFVNDYPEEVVSIPNSSVINTRLLVNKKNEGIHKSRINGLAVSNGDIVQFLDQDDETKPQYLYSQLKEMEEHQADVVVCNGWLNRFLTIISEERRNALDNLNEYLSTGNKITSPGQCLIKKSAIPSEWTEYAMKINGADDYLLWIMMLKRKCKFIYNQEMLYYHTPSRTIDSVNDKQMLASEQELYEILKDIKYLDKFELSILQERVMRKCYLKSKAKFDLVTDSIGKSSKLNEIANAYEKIAIYGMGNLGQFIMNQLAEMGRAAVYGIDRSAVDYLNEFPIYRAEDDLPLADMIIVAVLEKSEDIKKKLIYKTNFDVITYEDLF